MTVHTEVGAPAKWVPVTDEIIDKMYGAYCVWIINLTEIRERMQTLRDQYRTGWTPPPEIRVRLNDLYERDEEYSYKHMDVARAFLDAAERDVDATKIARAERRSQLVAALGSLKHAWEHGWKEMDTWTREERVELQWLIYANPDLEVLFRVAEQNLIYFCQKAQRLKEKLELERTREAERYALGMVPRLGIKKFGKQLKKARR